MTHELVRYNEPLSGDELAFLSKREAEDRSQYYRVIRIAMVLSFICPFIIAWLRALEGEKDPFSPLHYFFGVFCLLGLSALGIYIAYTFNLRKIQYDIMHRTKTIEQTHITRKQFMPHNNTYHFYIDSPVRISIEVSQEDYRRLDQGDELSIEYTTYAKLYLGYF